MKKFLFSLETLLRYREQIEQKKRDELSRIIYKHQMELQHHRLLNMRRQETLKELTVQQSENASIRELNWFYLYIDRLDYEIRESEERLLQLEKEMNAQRAIVIEASKKTKILSTMRAKREKEYIDLVDKQEQKDIDEIVVTHFAAKGQTE